MMTTFTSVAATDYMPVLNKANAKFEQKDYNSALVLFKQAFSLGDSIESPMRIGEMYIRGLGTDANEHEGIKWVTLAANRNNAEAQSTLGRYYYQIEDYSTAFNWNMLAAQNGDNYGKYSVGQAYLEGIGTAQDTSKALRWTLSAAIGGHPGAQWEMARAYFEGHDNSFDLDSNADEFISWTKKAAENGVPIAQYYMGLIYLDGFNNTRIDKANAKMWITKAAEQGLQDAISTLKERF